MPPPARRSSGSTGTADSSWRWRLAPDGKRILSGSLDKTAKIWQVPGGGPRLDLADHPAGVHALALRPDGKQAAAASAKLLRLWDLSAGTPVKDLTGHAGEVESAGLARRRCRARQRR